MNKIINANINGFIFPIDEIAYEQLKIYLEQLRRGIVDAEVYQDMEIRIAELFSHKLKSGKAAILEADVNEVIVQLGSVDELVDSSEQESTTSAKPEELPERRLFRDIENKSILGVCAGIAAYLQWDIKWVRLGFLVAIPFTGGLMFFIYFLLGVALQPAVTPAEKLQMHGKPITLDNLGRVVEEAAKNTVRTGKPLVESVAKNGLPIVAKILAAVMLVFLLIITIPALFTAIVSAGFAANLLEQLSHYFFVDWTQTITVFFAALIVGVIPVMSIMYSLVRILVNGKKLSWFVRVPFIVLWWVAFSYLIGQSIMYGKEFSGFQEVSSASQLPGATFDKGVKTITLSRILSPDEMEGNGNSGSATNGDDGSTAGNTYYREDDVVINGHNLMEMFEKSRSYDVEVIINRTSDSLPYVMLKKSSMGSRNRRADNAKAIEYAYKWDGNKLALSDFFTLGGQQKWRNQKVRVMLYVPIGYKVKVDENCMDRLEIRYNEYSEYYFEQGKEGYKPIVIAPDGNVLGE